MKIIDLTQTLKTGMRGFSSLSAKTTEKDGWNASLLEIYSHAGTHIDAQPHFGAGKTGIDRIPVENFVAECQVIDLTGIPPRSVIKPDSLGKNRHQIKPGNGLIIKTGWSKYVDEPEMYRNSLLRVGEELALWCVRSKIRMLAVEPPSVADVNNITELKRIHTLLLKAGIVIIEGLTNTEQFTSDRVLLIALPLKIECGDGAPCRVIAMEGKFSFKPDKSLQ